MTVRVVDLLRKLDDRLLPNGHRWRGRSDRAFPLWMYFGSLLGPVIGVLGAQLATHGHGSARVAGLVTLSCAFLGYLVCVLRWQKSHRLGECSEESSG